MLSVTSSQEPGSRSPITAMISGLSDISPDIFLDTGKLGRSDDSLTSHDGKAGGAAGAAVEVLVVVLWRCCWCWCCGGAGTAAVEVL